MSRSIASRRPSALRAATRFAGLLVVSMLLQVPQDATLLQLHVEALEGAVDRFVLLNNHVYQRV